MTIDAIIKDLYQYKNPQRAISSQGFFKTKKGEYGAGDIFMGATVPQIRLVSRKYASSSLEVLKKLIRSKIHEERLLGLIILANKFRKNALSESEKEKAYKFYCKQFKYINNWDLVDSSASYIVGCFLADKKDRTILKDWAQSDHLWTKRISIISTHYLIRHDDFKDALSISKLLLNDEHDLIHKAVGWMLREIGNRDKQVEEKFLKQHYKKMPRTMLRYAIEKFPKSERQKYLKGTV
jgi:3-methyladenine DNA glycosylase AlkD